MKTPTSSLISIKVSDIAPNAFNPRPEAQLERSNPIMQELVRSITAHGLLQPITVRQSHGATKYEIVVGERRWTAHLIAELPTIEAVVRERTDMELKDDLLIENLQRADIPPVEEARFIASLLDEGRDIATIASKLGKSTAWTAKRARIAKLSSTWLEFIEKKLPAWTIDHIALIARYEEDTQLDILKDLAEEWDIDGATVERLSEHLVTYFHDVERTPWKKDDADLLPAAGACTDCTKRTSCQALIFSDEKIPAKKGHDRCTDHLCWNRKLAAHFEQRQAKLREEHPELLKISTSSWSTNDDVLGLNTYETCKKSDKDARPAISMDGASPGKLTWIKAKTPSQYERTKRVAVLPGDDRPLPSIEEKRAGLDRRRTILAFTVLLGALNAITPDRAEDGEVDISGHDGDASDEETVVIEDDHDDAEGGDSEDLYKGITLPKGSCPNLGRLVAWINRYGCRDHMVYHAMNEETDNDPFTLFEEKAASNKDGLVGLLWQVAHPRMVENLKQVIAIKQMESPVPRIVASMIDVDLEALVQHATAAIAEPKAWRTQYPDAYLPNGEPKPASKGKAAKKKGGTKSKDSDAA